MTEKINNIEAVGGGRKFTKPKTEILPLTDQAREYLTTVRGLSAETLEAYKVGSTKYNEIAIPFYDEAGELQLVKFRHAEGKMLKRRKKLENGEFEEYEGKSFIEPGGKPVLLGSHLCDPDAGPLVICFGDYDAMSVDRDGVPNCVSLPFGDKGFDFIKHQWDFLERFSEIVIYNDDDKFDKAEAELKAKKKLEELATRLGKHRCRIVGREDRQQTKDANELLVKVGAGANREAVENADWFPTGIVAVADYQEPEMTEGTPIGLPDIDRATGGLGGGHLIILSGDNGAGKTTEALNFAAEFIEDGSSVFLWSGEQKVGRIRYWYERIVAGKYNLKTVTQDRTKIDYYFPAHKIQTAVKKYYRNFLFQYTETGVDAQAFFEAAELGVRRYGCRLIIIDNLMAFTGGAGDEYYQEQGDFAESCKRFAEKWDVAILLICHNRKAEKKIGKPRIPDKDDIEGSKKITNWADFVIQLFRVPESFRSHFGDADTILSLCKNRETGILEDVKMTYDKESLRLCQAIEKDFRFHREFSWTKFLDEPREPRLSIYDDDETDADIRFK